MVEVLAGLAALVTIWVFLADRTGSGDVAVPRDGEGRAGDASARAELPGPPPAPPGVVICEVVVKGAGMDPLRERITLCNHGPAPVDLGGWTLEDGQGDYAIPHGTGVLPGGRWSVAGAELNPRGDRRGLWLNDTGDLVRLLDPAGRRVDECRWPPKTASATCTKIWY